MLAYFVFTLTCILVFTRRLRFLLLPSLFFIVYGAIGNAISHTWWSLYLRAYFPGLVTAQVYGIVGPLVLCRLVGRPKVAFSICILFAIVLILLLTIFASAGAIAGETGHPGRIGPRETRADWDAWMQTPLSELNGQSPVQAGRHEFGRHALGRLLKDFARQGRDVSRLKSRLGV